MAVRSRLGALTFEEKKIVKALLGQGMRNQDIQALVNSGRKATVNSARITGVKRDARIHPATEDEVEFFKLKKRSFDPKTGLNSFEDERLIRARDAMLLAVQIFNSPLVRFKTEVFSVLASIAWTYLLHEHYIRKNINIVNKEGFSLLLSQILKRADCPLSAGANKNLSDVIEIRNTVEHKLLGLSDPKWLSLFQACCLNFETLLCKLFGPQASLLHELSVSLQFAKLGTEQIATLQKFAVPEYIEALDARLTMEMTEEQLQDLEYRMRVVYTLDASTKGEAHFAFVSPGSDEGLEIRNVLQKFRPADELYPLKAGVVVSRVRKLSGKRFSLHNHTQAWRHYRVRQRNGSDNPSETNRKYCRYHQAHEDYTYSEEWVKFLATEIADEKKYATLKAQKI